jgi:hypothetical protein
MHFVPTITTVFGRCLAAEPASPSLLSSADRAALARRLDREADAALAHGDVHLADALSWRAAGLREAAP